VAARTARVGDAERGILSEEIEDVTQAGNWRGKVTL
jgi:hypothetical protein